jgi:hypothetical protein
MPDSAWATPFITMVPNHNTFQALSRQAFWYDPQYPCSENLVKLIMFKDKINLHQATSI